MSEGIELAKAYVQIIPSAQGIKGKISEAVGGEAESAGKTSGEGFGRSFVSAAKGLIAAAGIGKVLKDTISEGAALQQSIGGIETLFGTGGQSIEEFASKAGKSISEVSEQYHMLEAAQELALGNASKAYETAGLSANDYMETVTGFAAALKGSTKDELEAAQAADKAVVAMADNANKMGTDMQSIQNAYAAFAKGQYNLLDNLKIGYGGSKKEMERLLADAEKLTGVKYDINNLSDVYSAIGVIQDKLGITGTTAKEAASTLSGSMASMKGAFKNLLGNLALGEDIGPSLMALGSTVRIFLKDNLLPMVGNILKQLPSILFALITQALMLVKDVAKDFEANIIQGSADFINEFANYLGYAIPEVILMIGELLGGLIDFILRFDWLGTAANIITSFTDGFRQYLGEAFGDEDTSLISVIISGINEKAPLLFEKGIETISGLADMILSTILDNLPSLISTGTEVVSSLFDTIFSTITTYLPTILEKGVEVISTLANGFLSNLPAIISSIGELLGKLIDFIFDNAPVILEAGFELIANLAKGLVDNLPAIIAAIVNVISSLLAKIGERLPEFIKKAFEIITQLAVGLIKAIPTLVSKIPEIIKSIKDGFARFDWMSIGINIIKGIINGLKSMVGSIGSAIKDVAGSAFDAVTSFLGIHSPSTKMEKKVGWMVDFGMAKGIVDKKDVVADAMQELNTATISMAGGEYDVNYSVESSNSKIDRLIYLFEKFAPRFIDAADKPIVLEDGTLVARMAPAMDGKLGEMQSDEERAN